MTFLPHTVLESLCVPFYTVAECCKSQDVEPYPQRSDVLAGFHSIKAGVTADRLGGQLRAVTFLFNKKHQMWLLLAWLEESNNPTGIPIPDLWIRLDVGLFSRSL